MSAIENQTPPPPSPRPRRAWRDWLVILLTVAGLWFGLCWLVQYLAR